MTRKRKKVQPMFAESDRERLVRRLRAVTAGDLSGAQVQRLAEGDLSLVADLSLNSKVAVSALIAPGSEAKGQLEKMVGTSLDYVPVSYLDLARRASSTVLRIVDEERRAVGTGTMISPRILLTNNHVTGDAENARRQIVQFDYELSLDGSPRPPVEFKLDPDAFFWTSPQDELDASLIAIGRPVFETGRALGEFGFCPLSAAGDKHAEGDFVTIVQHPEGDFKQIALRENRVIGRGQGGTTLHYGTDTLPGSSGSPVFNDRFELVALHHAGGTVNETNLEGGTPVPEESNEGIRISALVEKLRVKLDELPEPYRTLLAEALDPPASVPQPAPETSAPETLTLDGASAPTSPLSERGVLLTGGSVQADLSLPLRLAVQVREPGSAPPPTTSLPTAPAGVIERNQAPRENYSRRRGYDSDFLETPVPLPNLSKDQLSIAAVPENESRTADGVLLNYFHFTVVQNGTRRMPFFTAVNIDGRRARGINRQTGEVEATEKWYSDPRLDASQQLDQAVFEKQRPRLFDRGHLVRRLDPAWGSAGMAQKASDDTFHFTNCCPQISGFNQRARLWAGIENYVLDNAKAERARICVFTGPVFHEDDPEYRGVLVPRAFWKLLIRLEVGQLRCTAFLADQDELLKRALQPEGPEAFDDLGRVAVFQSPISTIETETGLDFGELASHDTAALEAPRVEIDSLDDVVW